MSPKYVFDRGSFSFKQAPLRIWRLVRRLLLFLLTTVSLTVAIYFVLSLFLSTETERRLRREIRMYEKTYPLLEPKEQLIRDGITGLQVKDDEIYRQIFHTDAPNVDPIGSLDFLFASDTLPDAELLGYTRDKSIQLTERSARVDEAFRKIFLAAAGDSAVMPPMALPLEDISYPQVGATRGQKINPFYKAYVQHNGLDLIAPQEASVLATADGTVSKVTRSSRGQGNLIELTHAGGYKTRYAHLSDIAVKEGQKVRKGARIGSVGMSGSSYAPHLHYEVLRNDEYMDPINYLFGAVSPEEYSNMLFMAVNTEQSMD
ncbi:MAG: M23 family metallopeptidase [Bacteroidales bacterium]|nr:M23 family metallopeptidase [Bacteroidales bacterium]